MQLRETYQVGSRTAIPRADNGWRQPTTRTILCIPWIMVVAAVRVSTFAFLKDPISELKHLQVQWVADQLVIYKP